MVESFVIGYLFLQLDIGTVFSGLKASLRRKVIICFPHTRKKRYSIWNLLSWVERIAPQSSNNIRLPQNWIEKHTFLYAVKKEKKRGKIATEHMGGLHLLGCSATDGKCIGQYRSFLRRRRACCYPWMNRVRKIKWMDERRLENENYFGHYRSFPRRWRACCNPWWWSELGLVGVAGNAALQASEQVPPALIG